MFKLLALKVLEGCADHIKKCLHKDIFYYFCSDFRFEDDKVVYRGSNYIKPLPENYFTLPKPREISQNKAQKSPFINLNAIVGKNGDGKSTVIELIIRMVNNFVVAQQREENGLFDAGRELHKVEGVAAELYIQIDDSIYILHITDDEQRVIKIATITDAQPFSIEREVVSPSVLASIYTFVSNYSHYAYNVYDFTQEWDLSAPEITEEEQNKACWLFHIFHKNDGYITPISLHPYRVSGIIDINKEARLSKQRLLYLFLNSPDTTDAFRNVLIDKVAIELHLNLEAYSKFHQRCVKDHFIRYEEVDSSWDRYINFLQTFAEELEKDPYLPESELKNLRSKYLDKIEADIMYTLNGTECEEDDRCPYLSFLDTAMDWLSKEYLSNPKYLRDSSYLSNIDSYFSLLNSIRQNVKCDNKEQYLSHSQIEQSYRRFGRYNIRQLARLRTIYDVAVKLKINPALCFTSHGLSHADRCRLYMIYKAISIFETYPSYTGIVKKHNANKKDNSGIEYSRECLSELINKLYEDKTGHSHITRKYAQAENYIEAYINNGYKDIYHTIAGINDDRPIRLAVDVPIDALQEYYKDGISLENMPPAIFDTEIVFRTGDGAKVRMSALSSGEKQLLNSIGAIIYHLQNIESNGSYHTVNLILEEIELYFHPEYQRLYVMLLMKQIYGVALTHIRNINITFVTHSPFVLSDIPKCNVLFLNDGKPDYRMQENTFGANIHSLLKNGFFLPNLPIGEFANQKINELFRQLNSYDYDHSEGNINRIKEEIALIGEPYLREQLFRLLREKQ